MWSSPACGLKQCSAQVSPNKGIRWTEEAEAAIGTYAEQQKIEPGDLELFKCVQVQYETQGPQDTLRESIHCILCTDRNFHGQDRERYWRRHMDIKSTYFLCPVPGCSSKKARKDDLKRHVRVCRVLARALKTQAGTLPGPFLSPG